MNDWQRKVEPEIKLKMIVARAVVDFHQLMQDIQARPAYLKDHIKEGNKLVRELEAKLKSTIQR